MPAEDHPAHTDHHQWAATEAAADVDDPPHHEADGEDAAGEEAEEDVEVETSDTGRAHTPGLGAGHHEGAYHDHRTVGHLQEHRQGAEGAVVVMGGETRRRGEGDEEEVVVAAAEEGARVMIRTTVRARGVGAGTVDKISIYPFIAKKEMQ